MARSADVPDDMLDGLLSGAIPRQTSGVTIESRRRPPKKRTISARDGRYQRSKGRTERVSTMVRPDVFEAVTEACAQLGVPKAEFYELAMAHLAQRIMSGDIKSLDDIDPPQ